MANALLGPFGRFGFVSWPPVQGFDFDATGFAAKSAAADRFRFPRQLSKLNCTLADQSLYEAVIVGGGPGAPIKVRQSLLSPGFELGYVTAPTFKLSSTLEPYLTWGEASVGSEVPTPQVQSLIVSFRDSQPPIGFLVPDGSLSWVIEGKPGQWTLRADKPLRGWLKICAPLGTRPFPTNTAAELGRLVDQVKPAMDLLQNSAPRLLERRVSAEGNYTIISWLFDRSGALVPPAALLATLGGYPLRIESPLTRLPAETEDGPMAACNTDTLRIRFPRMEIAAGRAMVLGEPDSPGVGTVSAFDLSGVAELAMTILQSTADSRQLENALQTSEQFLSESDYLPEPNTRQSLPLATDGATDKLLAVNSLLAQAVSASKGRSDGLGGLIRSLLWTRDFANWRLRSADLRVACEIASICSVAALLGNTEESRAEAALLEAGVAAASAWSARKGDQLDPFSFPLGKLRGQLFRYDGPPVLDGYGLDLLSRVRVVADFSVRATKTDHGFHVSWQAPDTRPWEIAISGPGIKLLNTRGAVENAASTASTIRLKTTAEGEGWADFELAGSLPVWAAPPQFPGL